MKILKYSRQREAIKTCLSGRFDHPTADAVYADIRQEFPNISLGTVYRNLNLLVELGEAQKLTCGDGVDHFDSETHPHYHFICNHCGRVMDLPMAAMTDLNLKAEKKFKGHVTSHTIMFYGTCDSCLKKPVQ